MPSSVAAKPESPVGIRLRTIRSKSGMRAREVADLVGATPQTVSRWQRGRVEPQSSHLTRLLTLEWLVSQLAEFYEPAEARLWLLAPHALLGGDRPADRIQEGRTEDVLALIEQLKSGAYV